MRRCDCCPLRRALAAGFSVTRRAVTFTGVSGAEYLTALESRLMRIWRSRTGSPRSPATQGYLCAVRARRPLPRVGQSTAPPPPPPLSPAPAPAPAYPPPARYAGYRECSSPMTKAYRLHAWHAPDRRFVLRASASRRSAAATRYAPASPLPGCATHG